ncbi:hypothetical protein TNCV_2743131 [Trichonephila clavipes]|nr:hypothetical protein TNCV_2743131 [Trichonephila clavipes]
MQRQVIITGIVRSCGCVGHSTDYTNGRRIVEHVQTNPVCRLCQLKRRLYATYPNYWDMQHRFESKIRLSKQQDEDHERYAAQRYPTHVQSVTYPANTQAKEEAVPAANQDRI